MMPLSPSSPTVSDLKALEDKQVLINAHTSHADQIVETQKLWKAKDRILFSRLRTLLEQGKPKPIYCQYCEQSEESAIEHIYPKARYPERTFQWPNYLLACFRCNTSYKKDKCSVFYQNSTGVITELELSITRPEPPALSTYLFIDPRTENPLDFIEINLVTGEFVPLTGLNTHDERRAIYTFEEVLELNRNNLTRSRRNQYIVYKDKLKAYIDLKPLSTTHLLLTKDPIAVIKSPALMEQLKADILDDHHPTVWAEMKRQRHLIPELNTLFTAAPEALSW